MKEFQDIDEALAYVHGPPEEAPSTWHSPFDDDEAAVGLGPGTESNLKAAKAAQTAQMKKEPMAGLAPGVAAGPGTGGESCNAGRS